MRSKPRFRSTRRTRTDSGKSDGRLSTSQASAVWHAGSMCAMGRREVDEAVAELSRVLVPLATRDWDVRAGSLEWTCWETAVHIAHDLLAYAGQVAGSPPNRYLPFDLVVPPGTSPSDVLQVVAACGGILSSTIAAAAVQARGWHWGPTDPGGFAALGVNEILVHSYDITQGLSVDWRPPASLCAAVLDRLFPEAPTGDPVAALLWCTGRIELDDRPRRTSWVLKAAVD